MIKNWQKKKIDSSKNFQSIAYDEINELVFKERKGKQVILADGSELTEFVSCSYLGLDVDSRIINASNNNIFKCGVTFSAARTRIQAESFVTLENLLNQIFCHGYSTTFSTLHLGHLGVLPMLGSGELPSFPCDKGGFSFILDKTVHSSIQIQRALMQQFGEVVLNNFNDHFELEDLFRKSNNERKTPVAIVDSIGSMGGVAPVQYLFNLAEKYNGYIYLDDAHGTSIYGKHGCGYALQALGNTFHPRLILASSLAKAFGAIAGVIILPTKSDANMLKRFSPTYVFSGPPALTIIDSAIESAKIHLTDEIYKLQEKLQENIRYFDSLLQKHVINESSPSPIRGILIGDEYKTIKFTKLLRGRGFAVTAAMYPTVPKGRSILRIALSAIHEKNQILSLCQNIEEIMHELHNYSIL